MNDKLQKIATQRDERDRYEMALDLVFEMSQLLDRYQKEGQDVDGLIDFAFPATLDGRTTEDVLRDAKRLLWMVLIDEGRWHKFHNHHAVLNLRNAK